MLESFLVVGATPVAQRTCASLLERGFTVVHLARPHDNDLRAALARPITGIAVLVKDDVVALRYALAAAHIVDDVPMVVTIFDRTVADQLEVLLPQCDVTSPADLAAPSLVGPCLGSGIVAARRIDGGIEVTRVVGGAPRTEEVHAPRWSRWQRARTAVLGFARPHDLGARLLLGGLVGLLAMLVADWAWLVVGHDLPVVDALNEAVRVVTTVGPGTDPHGDSAYAVFASCAMLATVAFTAMLTAGIVDRLLGPRRIAVVGRRVLPRSHHVIVVGLGQVGLRLCKELLAVGIPVVGVERDPAAKNLRLVRAMNIPTVIGHGGDRDLLERIGIGRARALAAVGSDALDNIAVAVAAQALRTQMALVLRAGEQEAIAETRSLLPLGSIRDVTRLSAAYVVGRLTGQRPLGVVVDDDRVFIEVPLGESGPGHAPLQVDVSPHADCLHAASPSGDPART